MKTLKFVWRGHSCPRCMQRQIRLASKSARTTLSLRGLLQLRTICTVAFIVFLASTPSGIGAKQRRRGAEAPAIRIRRVVEYPGSSTSSEEPLRGQSPRGSRRRQTL